MNPELPHCVISVKVKTAVPPVPANHILTVMRSSHQLQQEYYWAVHISFYVLYFSKAGFYSVCDKSVSLAELMAQKHCTGVAFRFCQFKNFLHMICMVNLHSTFFSVIYFKYRSSRTCVRFSQQHVWVFHSSGMCYWLVILKESSAFIFKGLKVLRRMPVFLDSFLHGSPTCSPPDCIMWPVTTFVNYVYTIKIIQ